MTVPVGATPFGEPVTVAVRVVLSPVPIVLGFAPRFVPETPSAMFRNAFTNVNV